MATDITVEGTIAIKSIDGKYLKVLPNAGLSFTDQVYDDTAKFTAIKDANGRIRLRSCKSSPLGTICPGSSFGLPFKKNFKK